MHIVKLLILIFFINISLEANYCIQVLTTGKSELNFVINEAKNTKYSNFNSVRVESRGNYLVFRIGDYNSYRDALGDVENIRNTKKGAYIRKCDFVMEKALYIRDERKARRAVDRVPYEERVSYKTERPKQHIERETIKKMYSKKKELTYTYKNSNNSLWGDCKKCFIPVYEEEDSLPYKDDVKPLPIKRQQKREIRVEIPEPVPTRESFWAENTHARDVKVKTAKKRNRNKFNIDEQFLP